MFMVYDELNNFETGNAVSNNSKEDMNEKTQENVPNLVNYFVNENKDEKMKQNNKKKLEYDKKVNNISLWQNHC